MPYKVVQSQQLDPYLTELYLNKMEQDGWILVSLSEDSHLKTKVIMNKERTYVFHKLATKEDETQ